MKTRIISGALGIGVLVLILFLYDTILLNIAVSVVCAIMVYEIFCATKMLEKSFLIFIVSILFAISFPFLKIKGFMDYRITAIIIYVILNVFFLLKKNNVIRVYDLFFCCVFSILITAFTCNVIYIRDKFKPFGIYYIILLFVIPWSCDIGAYFVGLKFGKNKLAPKISPKKTIEGAVGGALFSFLFVFIYNLIFFNIFNHNFKINMLILAVATTFGVIFAIIGDLSMSVFKRQNKIKDFGNIIKGQGGMLDRFDSWIFVSAILYPIFKAFPVVLW